MSIRLWNRTSLHLSNQGIRIQFLSENNLLYPISTNYSQKIKKKKKNEQKKEKKI